MKCHKYDFTTDIGWKLKQHKYQEDHLDTP